MEFNELLLINSKNPPKVLLYKALMECEGSITFYQSEYDKDKRRYWQGKILEQRKQKKIITKRLEEVYGTKITNP